MNTGAFGENLPYTNFHDLNLDWIIKTLKEVMEKVEDASASKIKMADPFDWDITKNYETFTLVKNDEKVYLSTQPVPPGVSIANEEYWTPVFDLAVIFTDLKTAISTHDDGATGIASVVRYANELVWLNDQLYKVTDTIEQGQSYTDANTVRISIEQWVSAYVTALVNRITNAESAIEETNDNIESINNRLTPSNRKVLLVGDSYGMRNNPNYVSILTGELPNNYKGLAQSGWGFTNGDFYSEFDDLVTSLAGIWDTDDVTDIVFAGGWNDARELWAGRQTTATLKARIDATLEHAHSVCPNARIYTCFLAWHSGNSVQNQVNLQTLLQTRATYMDAIIHPYAGSIVDAQYIMRNTFFLDDSLFHPNASAARAIALAIHNGITEGSYTFDVSYTLVPAYLIDTGVTTQDFRMFMAIQNGITKLKSVPFAVNGTMTSNVLCKFDPKYIPIVMPDSTRSLYLTGWFKGTADGTTFNYTYAMLILYSNGELRMYINGQVLNTVQGNVIIDATVDNTNIY